MRRRLPPPYRIIRHVTHVRCLLAVWRVARALVARTPFSYMDRNAATAARCHTHRLPTTFPTHALPSTHLPPQPPLPLWDRHPTSFCCCTAPHLPARLPQRAPPALPACCYAWRAARLPAALFLPAHLAATPATPHTPHPTPPLDMGGDMRGQTHRAQAEHAYPTTTYLDHWYAHTPPRHPPCHTLPRAAHHTHAAFALPTAESMVGAWVLVSWTAHLPPTGAQGTCWAPTHMGCAHAGCRPGIAHSCSWDRRFPHTLQPWHSRVNTCRRIHLFSPPPLFCPPPHHRRDKPGGLPLDGWLALCLCTPSLPTPFTVRLCLPLRAPAALVYTFGCSRRAALPHHLLLDRSQPGLTPPAACACCAFCHACHTPLAYSRCAHLVQLFLIPDAGAFYTIHCARISAATLYCCAHARGRRAHALPPSYRSTPA